MLVKCKTGNVCAKEDCLHAKIHRRNDKCICHGGFMGRNQCECREYKGVLVERIKSESNNIRVRLLKYNDNKACMIEFDAIGYSNVLRRKNIIEDGFNTKEVREKIRSILKGEE